MGRQLLQGNADILADVIRTLGPRVEAVLQSRFPSLGPYIEDLLADSLSRLWLKRDTFDPEKGSLAGWWLTIAENAARDMLRARWQKTRHREISLGDTDASEPAESDPCSDASPPEPPSAEETALAEILEGLSQEDRQIILRYASTNGEGSWATDLARELKIPAGRIRVKRLRILKAIRAELKRRGHPVLPETGGRTGNVPRPSSTKHS
jgi:RNA polymerase sigma factor (sigma-70 family)